MTASPSPKDSAAWRHFLVTTSDGVPRYWSLDELQAAAQRVEPGAVALLQQYEVTTAYYLLTR